MARFKHAGCLLASLLRQSRIQAAIIAERLLPLSGGRSVEHD